ncbi:hypothetical protein ACLOJK_020210, partial [Asimina triloba]
MSSILRPLSRFPLAPLYELKPHLVFLSCLHLHVSYSISYPAANHLSLLPAAPMLVGHPPFECQGLGHTCRRTCIFFVFVVGDNSNSGSRSSCLWNPEDTVFGCDGDEREKGLLGQEMEVFGCSYGVGCAVAAFSLLLRALHLHLAGVLDGLLALRRHGAVWNKHLSPRESLLESFKLPKWLQYAFAYCSVQTLQ